MTLTIKQKKKIIDLDWEQWDRTKTDITSEDLKALDISREIFQALKTPNLGRVQFWDIIQKITSNSNCDLKILEEMLSKLYNALTDKQRTAIYEEMVEANYFLLECEQRKLKSLWQAASVGRKKVMWKELFDHNWASDQIKKKDLDKAEEILRQLIQKSPSYGLPGNNTPARQAKLQWFQEQLDQFRGSARKEMKTRLEILHEVVSELKEGLGKEVKKWQKSQEDLTGREPLRAPSIREGIERMELFSKEITTEMQALQKELQVFWEGYNGKFREGILGLKNLQEKFQATGKKLWDRAEIEGVEEFSLEVGTETIEKMGNLYSLLSLLVDSFGRKPATIRRLNHWFK